MDKTNKILVLSTITLIGFVIAVIYLYVVDQYMHLGVPYNSFLYPAYGAFCDFTSILPYIIGFNPYQTTTLWVVYFPITYLILYPFSLFKTTVLSYFIYSFSFVAYFIYMNLKSFSSENLTKIQNFQNIFILTVISYPFLCIMDKGNCDMYLFIIFGLCVFAFKSEKYLLSCILLALVNAMKPFTLLFLIPFLVKKKYKEFFFSIILSIILVIGGFLMYKGNLIKELRMFISSLLWFKINYMYLINNDFGMGFASSLYMPLKLLFCKSTTNPIISAETLVKYYNILCLTITIPTIFFIWKEKILWKQLTLITCHFLLLPCITYDYKLIFLFIPIWLFVNSKEKNKFDVAYTILFGLMLIPKHFVFTNPHITSPTIVKWFTLSIIANPIIMLLLMGLIMYECTHKMLSKNKWES